MNHLGKIVLAVAACMFLSWISRQHTEQRQDSRWSSIRRDVRVWDSQSHRRDGKPVMYVGKSQLHQDSYTLIAATTELYPDSTSACGWSMHGEEALTGFYVVPPGKWVETIDELIAEWKHQSQLDQELDDAM